MQAKDMALGGLLSALAMVILYMTYLIPTNTLTLLTLASFMVPLALIRSHIRTAFLVYITTTLLSALLLPPNISLMYGLFFGGYGLIKYFTEKLSSPIAEWVCKFLFFNSVFFIGLQTFIALISPSLLANVNQLSMKYFPQVPYGGFILLCLMAQGAFVVFDYALTLLIDMYYKYFPHH
ncbi:MAG: hypothetical protein ACRCWY_04700 [Cellulosilyticaceae bacterium]